MRRFVLVPLFVVVLSACGLEPTPSRCFLLESDPNLANDPEFNVRDCRFERD